MHYPSVGRQNHRAEKVPLADPHHQLSSRAPSPRSGVEVRNFTTGRTSNLPPKPDPAAAAIRATKAHGSVLRRGILPIEQRAQSTAPTRLICTRTISATSATTPPPTPTTPPPTPPPIRKKGGKRGGNRLAEKKFPHRNAPLPRIDGS